MRVVYLGRASRKTNAAPGGKDDVIELLSDNWNDFGYETTFATSCRINGAAVELGFIRLLISDVSNSRSHLNKLLKEGWDGTFPIPSINYISVPLAITFYEQLEGSVGADEASKIAQALRDASYLVRIEGDEGANSLVESEGFRKSLQRERGSIKSYLDAWKIFAREDMAVLDLGFRFRDVFEHVSTLHLKFQSISRLPHDINVLIGPNGSGKSRVLHQMVHGWINESEADEIGFDRKPNLSQIVVVSYSPFEAFPVDLKGKPLQDTLAYRYFGFRGRTSEGGRIRLSHDFPRRNAAQALISCLSDDKRYNLIRDWAQKVETAERVLRTAFDFDFAAVQIPSNVRPEQFYHQTHFIDDLVIDIESQNEVDRYIPIASARISQLNDVAISKRLQADSGVTFFCRGEPVQLSSGQRLFAYVVLNILGAIRRNSLILVDEPELFLHPTLEIQFIYMLKDILDKFNSKALLATHSVVTVREIPADCVHVFVRTDDGLVIQQPPFQTFGGDFQRISSYVFGDLSVSKPFEQWIKTHIEELGSAQAVLDELGDELNEELIVQIKAMGRD